MSNTNTCINGFNNCDHSEISGKGKLLSLSEKLVLHSEGIRLMCDANEYDTRQALYQLIDWMVYDKGWTKDGVRNLLVSYKKQVLDAHRNTDGEDVGIMQICCADVANREHHITDEYEDAYYLYEQELEATMCKSMGSVEATVQWHMQRLSVLNDELALHDKIQDALDDVEDYGYSPLQRGGEYKAVGLYISRLFKRIDQLFQEKKLSYDGWYMFNKQLMTKIGRGDEVKEPKFALRLLADRINWYEVRIEEIKQGTWDDKNIVSEMDLDSEVHTPLYIQE